MSLTDSTFSALADATLNVLADSIEGYDEDGVLDVELTSGILTISFPSGKQFVVSKHGPSRQLWLSSPLSGGLHFEYDTDSTSWILPDNRALHTLLRAEIETIIESESEQE